MGRVSAEAVERNRKSALARYHANLKENQAKRRESDKKTHRKKINNRPFIGWDGEGYNEWICTGPTLLGGYWKHRYMLFGASTGHCITGKDLGTGECLELILNLEELLPDSYHIGFAFEYDVNMILKDLAWHQLAWLANEGRCRWHDRATGKVYRIEHIPHKIFTVSSGGRVATIYDAFGFFHCSYMSALKKYGVGDADILARIQSGKDKRSSFTYADIEEVKAYWRDEISLFPPLMDKIREAAYGASYYIYEWYGPGALASYLLRTLGVKNWKSKGVPHAVSEAIRAAYAGGRFQGWLCGLYIGDIHTADINSAYIYACSRMPRMDRGKWTRQHPDKIDRGNLPRFGLFHIAFDARSERWKYASSKGIPLPPFPLFHRNKAGSLRWPYYVTGWYWTPEAELVLDSPSAKVLDVWFFDDDGSEPFGVVHSIYDRRLELQRKGDPAEKAFKWSLAAMYGAFARRVGWNKATKEPPASHELSWAGYITSWCRAAVFKPAEDVYMRGKSQGLISIDTDGVMSTVPFDESTLVNGVGDGLGQWKLEHYKGILYWQNGIYWLLKEDGTWEDPKTRGVPKGSIPLDVAQKALAAAKWDEPPYEQPYIEIERTGFVGYRQALQGRFDEWRTWVTSTVKINFGGTFNGKGFHLNDFMCMRCAGNTEQTKMHTVFHTQPDDKESQAHKLPWLEEQPDLLDNYSIEDFIPRDDDI
jgi:hypothetical protein